MTYILICTLQGFGPGQSLGIVYCQFGSNVKDEVLGNLKKYEKTSLCRLAHITLQATMLREGKPHRVRKYGLNKCHPLRSMLNIFKCIKDKIFSLLSRNAQLFWRKKNDISTTNNTTQMVIFRSHIISYKETVPMFLLQSVVMQNWL